MLNHSDLRAGVFIAGWHSLIVVILVLFVMTMSSPVTAADAMWDKRITHGTLPNGFSYYLYDTGKNDDPFNIRLIVHAGSVDEEKPSGVAHIVEHMVFQTTKAHPETLHRYFQKVGWRTGLQVNAVTRETETQYMVRTRPKDALDIDESLALIADMAFGAQLLDDDWQKERSVILQELALGNSVADRVNRQKKELLRIGSRYVGRPTIGTEETIKATTVADIKAFYERFYTASNMSLVVSGRVDKEKVEATIIRLFGSQPEKSAPDRSYVALPLTDALKSGLVQDAQGTTSQITYALRMAMPPRISGEGQFAYLQKYLLTKLIRNRVKELALHYADAESLSFVAQETTEERLVLAFGARTRQHNAALDTLFEVVERLRREGLDSRDVQREVASAHKLNRNNVAASAGRTYAEWEDRITSAILMNSVLADPEDRTERTRQLLQRVTPEILNDTLREMLSATDQVVLFQAAGDMSVTVPNVEQIERRREQIFALGKLPALAAVEQVEAEDVDMPPPVRPDEKKPSRSGHIESEKHIESLAIDEWILSNGDKVVWLARDNPDGKIYLSGQSSPGFHNAVFGSAVSQAAVQLWAQSGFRFWSEQDHDRWQDAQPSRWSFAIKGGTLDAAVAIKPEHLSQLMENYASTVSFGLVREEALNSLRPRMDDVRPEVDDYAQLLYGENSANLGPSSLSDATHTQLENAAQRLLAQPVTWFIVGPAPGAKSIENFAHVIGAVPRKHSLEPNAPLQRSGKHNSTVKTMSHGRAQVDITFYADMDWTPEKAFTVSTLTPIAQQAFKNELRLELGGVYSTRFELHLDTETNRAIGTLSFNCAPERTEELKTAALHVLEAMPDIVQKADIDRIRADISFAEQGKLNDPNLWLRRLALSYKRYGDARYLQTMADLGNQLSSSALQTVARKIFGTQNIATLIRLPKNTKP